MHVDSKYGITRVLFASTYTAKQLKTMYYSLSNLCIKSLKIIIRKAEIIRYMKLEEMYLLSFWITLSLLCSRVFVKWREVLFRITERYLFGMGDNSLVQLVKSQVFVFLEKKTLEIRGFFAGGLIAKKCSTKLVTTICTRLRGTSSLTRLAVPNDGSLWYVMNLKAKEGLVG